MGRWLLVIVGLVAAQAQAQAQAQAHAQAQAQAQAQAGGGADAAQLEATAGARIVDQARKGDVVYAALQTGGVAVVDLSSGQPRLVEVLARGRPVARVLVAGDVLYLIEVRQEAVPYALTDPRAPELATRLVLGAPAPSAPVAVTGTPAAPAATQGPTSVARVLEVARGRVIFSGGANQGFAPGQRVQIISQRMVEKPDLVTGGVKKVPSDEVTAVLQVEHAEADRAMAELGRGDRVAPGDLVEHTDRALSARLMGPRRATFDSRVGVHVRPFLGLGRSHPVGFLLDAYGAWYSPQWPLVLEVTAAPVGFVIGATEAHYPVTFAATASYAMDYFEIGLGAGALVGNRGPCGLDGTGARFCEENTGLTINQQLRIGALDGLSLTWRSSIFSRPEAFVFGIGRAEVALPVSSHVTLYGAGGGGENGWAFGEFGVRTYLGGAGARGTVIVTASLGGAGIFDGPSRETVAGPSVALGAEWRL